jgi:hypothetical protein
MSKKTLNTGGLVNELEGASAFFQRPASPPQPAPSATPDSQSKQSESQAGNSVIETASKDNPETANQIVVPSERRPPVRPYARTERVKIRRTITRYAFEFFQDQLETLKRFSLDEQLRGEKGSMSQMVREAIDAYIVKRKRAED